VNIYQKINEIKKEVAPLQKDVTVKMGKGSYGAVSHDQVLSKVNDLMIKYNVISYVSNVSDDTDRNVYQDQYGKPKGTAFTKCKMIVTFVNAEKPDELIHVHTIGHAEDSGDKAAGKAYTYSIKHAYLKIFGLKTGFNDEARYNYSAPAPMNQPTFNQQPQQGNFRR
jgi:hypothetical protein